MTEPGELAEALVEESGISAPGELDVEALALMHGMRVQRAELDGCAATLVGYGDRAIATIRPAPAAGRDRFSIGHEFGHWMLHRGQSFRCRADGINQNLSSSRPLEREADTFAAHLLMPRPLFNPRVASLGRPGFRQLDTQRKEFDTSLMATTLRLAGINTLPVVVACFGKNGRRWKIAAQDVPKRWWLCDAVDPDSFAYDVLFQGKPAGQGRQPADTWFTNEDAGRFEVTEHAVRTRNDDVLVLIYLEGEAAFHSQFDPTVGGRKYNQFGSYVPSRRK